MSDAGTEASADAAPLPEQGGGMRMPRSRGLLSGILLLLAGVWAAFIPFVGPAFHFAYTPKPHETWHWTAARGWFEVLPGGLAAFGGLLLIFSANRVVTSLGAWLAVLAGGWLVVAQQVYYLLTLGSPGMPSAAGDRRYVAEYLAFFTGVGALIILFGALAAGRLSVRSVRDVRAAARRDEQAALAEQEAAEREARDRDDNERAMGDRAVADRNAENWAGNRDSGYGTPGTTEPLPVAPVPVDQGRSASAVTTELPVAAHERYGPPTSGPDDDTAALPVVPERGAPLATAAERAPEPEPEHAPVVATPEPTPGPAPEPEPEPEREPEPEPEPAAAPEPPIVLEPPAAHPDAQRPPEPGGATPASGTATAWNPEAQSPTTTGEFPAVGATPAAPETTSSAGTPRRGVQPPRRYFGPHNPAPQDEGAARDPVRTDEADDLDDMDLDEPTR